MKLKLFVFALAGMVGLFAAAQSGAALPYHYYIEKDTDLYGNLDQDDIVPGGEVDCGPVAAVNSFVYLENKYPDIYDRYLVPDIEFPPDGVRDYDELINAAQVLAGAAYMNTKPPGGTWADMFIYGKWKYIEERVPDETIYAAQMLGMWQFVPVPPRPVDEVPPIIKPDWVQDNMYPTWQFIYTELVHCEDVEILISWANGGHYLTLTGFDWNDIDGDGIIDPEEEAVMKYINPVDGLPGESGIWNVEVGSQYEIMTDYETGAYVWMAVSESPIPEPATIAMVGMALVGIAGIVRKRLF